MTNAAVISRLRLIMAVVVSTALRGQKRGVMPGPGSRIVRGRYPVGVGCPPMNQHDKHEQQSCHEGHATAKDSNFGGEYHKV
jgi:hypothetical protein